MFFYPVEQGERGVQASPVRELSGEAAGGDGEGAEEDHRRRRRQRRGRRTEQSGAEGLQVQDCAKRLFLGCVMASELNSRNPGITF